MDLGLDGKVALVADGSRGIGRATALASAAEAVRVALDEAVTAIEGRAARSEEIADVIVFLASDQASFVTGTVVHVDGGATRCL